MKTSRLKSKQDSVLYSTLAQHYKAIADEQKSKNMCITRNQLYFIKKELDEKEFVINWSIRNQGFSFKKLLTYIRIKRYQHLLNKCTLLLFRDLRQLKEDVSIYDVS